MPQENLAPTLKVEGTPVNRVNEYVEAICAITGHAEPPFEAVTQPQLNGVIRAAMNFMVKQHKRETFKPADPE